MRGEKERNPDQHGSGGDSVRLNLQPKLLIAAVAYQRRRHRQWSTVVSVSELGQGRTMFRSAFSCLSSLLKPVTFLQLNICCMVVVEMKGGGQNQYIHLLFGGRSE